MENLRAIREKKGITQVKLSTDIGVTQETISAYESGKSYPSADILIKLAEHFNTSTDYLLDRTDLPLPVSQIVNESISKDELEFLPEYRKLNHAQKSRVMGFVLGMLE